MLRCIPTCTRKGGVHKGQTKNLSLDHTAYRLIDVHGVGAQVKLKVRAPDGVRAGFALVAREGDQLSGAVTKQARFLDKGGKGTVTLASPGRFSRITAVIVNADGRVKGFQGNDWVYRKENQGFTATLR